MYTFNVSPESSVQTEELKEFAKRLHKDGRPAVNLRGCCRTSHGKTGTLGIHWDHLMLVSISYTSWEVGETVVTKCWV
jgi:hypothetical protein